MGINSSERDEKYEVNRWIEGSGVCVYERERVGERKRTRASLCVCSFASSISSARNGRTRRPLQRQRQQHQPNSAHSPASRIRTVFSGEEYYTLSRTRKYEFGSNLKSSRVRRFASFTRCCVFIASYGRSHRRGQRTPSSRPCWDGNDRRWKWWRVGWGFVMRSRNHLYQLPANGDRVRVTKCPGYTDASVIL